MTIAAVFRASDSFVFASDTLFTYNETANTGAFASYGKKIFTLEGFTFSVVMTGAGHGELLRAVAESFTDRLHDKESDIGPEEAPTERIPVRTALEAELSSLSTKMNGIPELSLLVGVRQRDFGLDFLRSDGL